MNVLDFSSMRTLTVGQMRGILASTPHGEEWMHGLVGVSFDDINVSGIKSNSIVTTYSYKFLYSDGAETLFSLATKVGGEIVVA